LEMKQLLHVGAGPVPAPVQYAAYKEVRLDVSKEVNPDIQASIVALPMIEDKSFDAVYASHVLEHVAWHEVHMALSEFWRVLKDDGVLEMYVPDLQALGGRLAADEAERPIYQSSLGPITALDMLYGHRGQVAMGHPGMAHKCGFTQSVLRACLARAGFERVSVERSGPGSDPNLHVLALKGEGNASEESGSEGFSERHEGSRLGQAPSFRQQREVTRSCG
jgi:SAM-dependent methyltransferase